MEEWGKPEHDEQKLYEMFVLEFFSGGRFMGTDPAEKGELPEGF